MDGIIQGVVCTIMWGRRIESPCFLGHRKPLAKPVQTTFENFFFFVGPLGCSVRPSIERFGALFSQCFSIANRQITRDRKSQIIISPPW